MNEKAYKTMSLAGATNHSRDYCDGHRRGCRNYLHCQGAKLLKDKKGLTF